MLWLHHHDVKGFQLVPRRICSVKDSNAQVLAPAVPHSTSKHHAQYDEELYPYFPPIIHKPAPPLAATT